MSSLPRLICLSLLNLNKPIAACHLNQIHAQLITNSLKSPPLFAKLIDQYCAVSLSSHAHLVFKHFGQSNLFLLNTLIRCTQPKNSLLVFAHWFSKGDLVFDDFTYIFIFGACARASSLAATLWEGREIHGQVLKHGVMSNILVQTTMIHFYANNKDVFSARRVFDEMVVRSNVTWNAMITGYCTQRGRTKEYARDALVLFQDMLTGVCGVKPTDTTMVCVLSMASQLGVLESGACVHGYIEKTVCVPENDVFIGTGLVDMYAKCGCLESALSVFWQMNERNLLTWTAMSTGLAIHGRAKEALELLDSMGASGIKPNVVTFTSLLSACCHVGLVEEGLHLFDKMRNKFGVLPVMQHYGCMVDLLGRAGHLKEAYEFIMGMQIEPDAIIWRSLLSSCKVHGDVIMGEKVGKLLLQLQPEKSDANLTVRSEDFVALSNVYATAERWGEVEIVRKEMKVKGIDNKPGCSSVQSMNNYDLDAW